ncbi:hypothetical protein V1503_23585 [Bacillus sp. SCS-151]|uniref:hypothetical protein n=1 Tax=Nanhaiella sioensis TaxID=3115293 RepID=UPI00397CA109
MHYLNIVKDYLDRRNTKYGLFITGEAGCGKTYFWNSYVRSEILRRGLRPIYISLYGLTTIEAISQSLYFESIVKNKINMESREIKYTKQAFKFIWSVAELFTGAGEVNVPIDYQELITFGDGTVLCFDDFERSNINITELLGYINNFVEHDGIKTIIIGNEEEITEKISINNKELKAISVEINQLRDKKPFSPSELKSNIKRFFNEGREYQLLKDKVIGKTIYFEPSSEIIINSIVAEYEAFDLSFYKFLEKQKSLLLKYHNLSEKKNIKIINHFISDFRRVYSYLSKVSDDYKYIKDIGEMLFIPAFIIYYEYKVGNIERQTVRHLKSNIFFPSVLALTNPDAIFYKYFSNTEDQGPYIISETFNNYIITDVFNIDNFSNEIIGFEQNLMYKYETEYESPESSFKKLTMFWNLDEDEFRNTVSDVLSYVTEGKYQVSVYPTLFYFFEYLKINNLIQTTIDVSIDNFINGLEKAFNNHLYDVGIIVNSISDINKSNEVKQLEEMVNEKNHFLLNTVLESEINAAFLYFPKNIKLFKLQVLGIAMQRQISFIDYISIEDFFEDLVRLKNSDLNEIKNTLEEIYSRILVDYAKWNNKRLLLLLKKIDGYLNINKSGIKSFILRQLKRNLELICEKSNS